MFKQVNSREYFNEIEQEDYCYEIKDCETASADVRDYVYRKKQKYKENVTEDLEKLYNSLCGNHQIVVNAVIREIVGNRKLKEHSAEYLNVMRESFEQEYGIQLTSSKLASYIENIIQCDADRGITRTDFDPKYLSKDAEDIRKQLDSFLARSKTKDNKFLEYILCEIYGYSVDVLATGSGIKYSIDFEYIQNFFNNDNDKIQELYYAIADDLNPCKNCKKNRNTKCSYTKKCQEVTQFFKEEQAKAIAKRLNVPLEDILIEENIMIIEDPFPWKEYYNKMNFEQQKVTNRLIRSFLGMNNEQKN